MHNVDVFEVLSDLEDLLDDKADLTGRVDLWILVDFITNQRGIYGGGQGECAAQSWTQKQPLVIKETHSMKETVCSMWEFLKTEMNS